MKALRTLVALVGIPTWLWLGILHHIPYGQCCSLPPVLWS